MKHLFREHWGICPLDAKNVYCPVCAGKFQFCERCCLFTGCLTTECPNYNAYVSMGTYVYYGVADYVNWQWVYPGTDIRIYEAYKEALRYQVASEYDVQILPAPNLRKQDYSGYNEQAKALQVRLPSDSE